VQLCDVAVQRLQLHARTANGFRITNSWELEPDLFGTQKSRPLGKFQSTRQLRQGEATESWGRADVWQVRTWQYFQENAASKRAFMKEIHSEFAWWSHIATWPECYNIEPVVSMTWYCCKIWICRIEAQLDGNNRCYLKPWSKRSSISLILVACLGVQLIQCGASSQLFHLPLAG